MSSRGQCGVETSRPSRIVSGQPAEHFVADLAPQGADCLGLRIAGGHPVGHVIAPGPGMLELGDRNPVEGQVELAMAAAIEAMANDVARPDRDRRGSIVRSKRRPRAEAPDPTGLPVQPVDRAADLCRASHRLARRRGA